MNEDKWTVGEYVQAGDPSPEVYEIGIHSSGFMNLAVCYGGNEADIRPNAELICAAVNTCRAINPDNPLAAATAMEDAVMALEAMVTQFPEWGNHSQYAAIAHARLTLAKLKGGEQ